MADTNTINYFQAMMNPQFASQQLQIQRQQALAQQLMDEGSKPLDNNQLANPNGWGGGFVVPVSPLAAAGKAVEKGLGGYLQGKALAAQMNAYAGLAGQQTPDQSPEGQGGAPLLPWQTNALTGRPQGEALGNALAGGNNPYQMTNTELYHDMMARGSGTAEFNARIGRLLAGDKAAGSAPYDTVTLADGTIVPKTTVLKIPSLSAPSQPLSQGNAPQGNPAITPNSPAGQAALGEMYDTKPETNVMPNPIPGTTPGVPAVNPNSPEGAARAALLKAQGTAVGENIAAADKGVVGIDSRIANTMKTLDEMAALSNQKGHGDFGEYIGVPWSRNIGSGQEAGAQTVFERKNANLFTQELGPLMQSIQGTKGSVPLINAIKEASQIPPYGAKPEELGAIANLKEQLRIYQNNMHNSAAMSKGQPAPQSSVTHIYIPGKGIMPAEGQ